MTDLTTTVTRLIALELGDLHLAANRCEAIQPGDMLDGDLGVSSIDRVCIAVALDEHFGIELPDDDLAAWTTVSDVVRSVAQRVAVGVA